MVGELRCSHAVADYADPNVQKWHLGTGPNNVYMDTNLDLLVLHIIGR